MSGSRIGPRTRAALATLRWGALIGLVVLGIGGRVAMRIIAESTTGSGFFSIGGTFTVVAMGVLSGTAGAVLLLLARTTVWRWPPAPTLLFHGLLLLVTLRGLRPLDEQRLLLFLPLMAVFGALLQWRTWAYREAARATLRGR